MMTPKKKRHLTYVTIGVFYFLGGVEYAVILPTAWLRLKECYHSDPHMLGILLSAFSLSGIIAAPLMGKISDRTKNTKGVILAANVFEIVGSVMYLIGHSDWFLVASRFIAGIGTGVGSAIYADIARVTPTESRTRVLSTFMAIRQVGLVVGPAFNLFLREFHFHIGPLSVDKYSSPGLLMALLWVLLQFMVFFIYWNLPGLHVQETVAVGPKYTSFASTDNVEPAPILVSQFASASLPPIPSATDSFHGTHIHSCPYTINTAPNPSPPQAAGYSHAIHTQTQQCLTSSDEYLEGAERILTATPRLARRHLLIPSPAASITSQSGPPNTLWSLASEQTGSASGVTEGNPPVTESLYSVETQAASQVKSDDPYEVDECRPGNWRCSHYLNEFIREEVIALLFVVFVSFFNQFGLETMLTPLTEKLLHWSELENSVIYCLAGVEIIVTFVLIRWMSQHFSDRVLVALGFAIESLTMAFFLWFLPQVRIGEKSHILPGLIIGIFFNVLGLPFLAVASASLFSKITSQSTQGFAQGIRRVAVGSAAILASIWASSLVQRDLYLLLGVIMGLNILAAVMLMLSYKRLKEPDEQQDEGQPRRTASPDETQPLLS